MCTALDSVGTKAVLTGGSAATFYVPHRYQSLDADFVITFGGGATAAAALQGLGFTFEAGMYRHASSRYTLEFPRGPLSIGDEHITNYSCIERGTQKLYVLERTDCIRDRLAAFYFWSDRSSLKTAIAVAQSGEFDLQRVEEWSILQNAGERFAEFVQQL